MNPNDPMFVPMVQSLLTKLLTIAGAVLVQRGLIGATDLNELALGLGMLLASIGVSWYRAKFQNRVVAAAIQAPPTATVVEVHDAVRDGEKS